MKAITISISTEVQQSRQDVFAYLSNFSNHKDLISANIESAQTSDGPVGIGTTMRNVAKFMVFRMEEHFIVTEYEENVKITKASKPGSTHVTTDTFELSDLPNGSTLISLTVYAELTGLYELFSGPVERKIKSILQHDLDKTKERMEQPGWIPNALKPSTAQKNKLEHAE